jgi:hypothetical protein
MGFDQVVVSLRRDDAYILEGRSVRADADWVNSCLGQAHWFNPNKHRHAAYEATLGAHVAAESGAPWPQPWLGKLIATDRPDLAGSKRDGLESWLLMETLEHGDEYRVTLAAWDRERGFAALPHGGWPSREARLLRAQLWTAVLRAEDLDHAIALVRRFAVSESRQEGLLIHPHMEGWALVGATAKV